MKKEIRLIHRLFPIIALILLIVIGVIIMPQLTSTTTEFTNANGDIETITEPGQSIPLEIIFVIATIISVANLFYLKFSWDEILDSIVKKITQLVPAMLILFSIGILIGGWVYSGTIPVLIYYGVEIINPQYMYLVAFLVTAVFSIFTGTSWGSIGTIGVVLIGIGAAIDANLAITAAAIVGGAYFGDKLSPLSDSTNIAALAANVPLMEHIRSMMNTTVPSFIISAILYWIIGMNMQLNAADSEVKNSISDLKEGIASIYNFDGIFQIILLSIPILIVLYGSLKKKPTVPILITSAFIAGIIGMIVNGFSFMQMFTSLNTGFDTKTFFPDIQVSNSVTELLDRGGIYSMKEAVTIAISVFIYVGTLNRINAINGVIDYVLFWVKNKPQVIIASLFSTGLTNAMSSNQMATSYIIAEAFGPKYDELGVPRKVLSRSIEDYGTMLESLLPWTATGIYVFATLGVSPTEYWYFQFLSLIGFVIAIILALTGIGNFYKEKEQ